MWRIREQYIWWLGIGLLIAVLVRVFPFFASSIPLGYDPWLYRSMFLAYGGLEHLGMLHTLPTWIQRMYEPLLGMRWAIGLQVWWPWSDTVLLWWRAVVSCLPLLGIRLIANQRGKSAGIFAVVFAVASFTQYELFWRHYRKQIFAMFLLCVVIWWRKRAQWWQMVPLLSGLILLHRPAAVLVGTTALVWWIWLWRNKWAQATRALRASCASAGCIAGLVMLPLRDELVAPLRWVLVWWGGSGVDGNGWWVFLSVTEYLLVARPSLLLAGVGGWHFLSRRQRWGGVLHSMSVLLLIWIGTQALFFQRMLGYLDMVVVIYAGVGSALLRTGKIWQKYVVIGLLLIQSGVMLYRVDRTYAPLIEQDEFAFLSQIGTHLEEDAVIVVPWINYSPRVQGWTQREVVAPGLFDLNRWGTLDTQWETKRWSVSAEEKCARFTNDYPELRNRPVYLWIGSKQETTDLAGWCFERLAGGERWSRWKRLPE